MIKSFINKEGKEVFKLDQHGNLELTGNLSLGINGVLKAHTIQAFNNNDIIVVRNPEDMLPPYKGGASVVYYLGNDTIINEQEYVSGTWWEKYVLGYDCTVDTSIIYDSEFIVYEKTFRVIQNDVYSHNKEMLDLYPSTVKMVVSAVPDTEGNGTHWEVKYFDASDTLLYNDVLTSNFLYFAGYNFPFSSLDSNDFNNGSKDIVIDIVKVEALKEINKQDLSLYMPLAGGTFSGIINTTSIAPVEDSKYIIGSEAGRYKAGYFNELYTDILKAKEIDIESISLEEFKVQSSKANIVKGDGLLITDSEDYNNVKEASTLKFTDNTSRFLRQDGTFSKPSTYAEIIESIDTIQEFVDGKFILYKGKDIATLISNTSYVGSYSDSNYQLLIKGIEFANGPELCIIDKNDLNEQSTLILNFNQLLPLTISELIEENSSVTLVYDNYEGGWYVKGYQSNGVLTSDGVLNNKSITKLLNELISSDKVFNSITTANVIEVTISKYIWNLINGNEVEFDGVTTEKYLSKAGTWEYINIPNPEHLPQVIYGNFSVIGGIPEVSGIDDLTKGEYILLDSISEENICKISVNNHSIYGLTQTLYNIESANYAFCPKRMYRYQEGNAWGEWQYEYETTPNPRWKVVNAAKAKWRLPNANEFEYLLKGRADAEFKHGYVSIIRDNGDVVTGLLILPDYGNTNLSRYFNASKDINQPDVIPERLFNLRFQSTLFLPFKNSIIDSQNGLEGDHSITVSQDYSFYLTQTGTSGHDYYDMFDIKSLRSFNEYTGLFNGDDFVSGFPTKVWGLVRLVKEDDNGAFSVSETQKVVFSSGNLEHFSRIGVYRFAKTQFDTTSSQDISTEIRALAWDDYFRLPYEDAFPTHTPYCVATIFELNLTSPSTFLFED